MVGWVNRYIRYIALSYSGPTRGMYGIVHHVHARQPINLRPSGPVAGTQMRPPLAGEAILSTFKHALLVLQTSRKSPSTGPSTHVNHIMIKESLSPTAIEPTSRARLVAPTPRTRADRSCGPRDTTLSHSGRQRGAHGGGRHTGWVSVGRRGPGRLRPFAGTAAATAGRQRP